MAYILISSALNTGLNFGGEDQKNNFGAIKSVVFTLPTFSFATDEAAALKANHITAIRAKTYIPFPKTWNVEDMSADPVYATSESGEQKKTRGRKKIIKVSFDNPMTIHQAMRTFDNANLRVIPTDDNNNTRYHKNGLEREGFTLSMLNTEEMTEQTASGDTPALTHVVLQFADIKEWDDEGTTINTEGVWLASSLTPLTRVYLEQIGTASATLLNFRVYADGGKDNTGAVIKSGMAAFVKADFTATTTAGDDQTSAISGTVTDNGNGTYTAICTALATGTFNLVEASSLDDTTDLFDSHFGTADGEAALTVTP